MIDQVWWFESLGECICGKPATGTLRGPKNESYGVACLRCAEKRIEKDKKDRLRELPPRGKS